MKDSLFETPILFLTFNRFEKTKLVFDRIKNIKPTQLFISSDGYRPNVVGEKKNVEKIRNFLLDEINWECDVFTKFNDYNLGCKIGVSSAIDWFFENVSEGIILEDDCLPNQSFFVFCDVLLKKYRHDVSIGMISGNGIGTSRINYNESSYTFSKYPMIWGWASWKRVWDLYELNPNYDDKEINQILRSVGTKSKNFWINVYEKLRYNRIDTWDYQVTFTFLKNSLISVIPTKNLISNIGFDSEATHTKKDKLENSILDTQEIDFPLISPKIKKPNIILDRYYESSEFKSDSLLRKTLKKIYYLIFKS